MSSLVTGRPRPDHARGRLILVTVVLAIAASVVMSVNSRVVSPIATRVAAASAPAARPAGPASLAPDLNRLASEHPRQRVEVIIQFRRGVRPGQGRALVRALGGQPGVDLHIINALSARLTAAATLRLAVSPLVRAVSLNAPVVESSLVDFNPSHLATVFDASVQANKMWNTTTGRGVGVAVIDTGITGDIPDFQTSQTNATSRVVESAVIDPNATTASDTYGHGTDVGGLIAGNGGYRPYNDPLWGKYAGTAPDANLISIKISDDNGQASTLDAIYGLQFAVDHKADYNIRVVNMSFRSTSAQSYTTDPLDAAAEAAWFNGIVVVAAAGNLGTAPDAVSYAPGNDPYVITVGALDDQATKSTYDDVETSWSSQGTTQDGFQKPDVLAPGAHIVSTLAPGSAFATLCPSCIIGNSYFQASGTSMAAPIVSGGVADLIAQHPNWTPDMVKGAIVSSAVPLMSGGAELQLTSANGASGNQLTSNQGLTPNSLIDPNTGQINYTSASWSSGSWSVATSPLSASWSSASWSCSSCSSSSGGTVSSTSGSWSNLGWATFWG